MSIWQGIKNLFHPKAVLSGDIQRLLLEMYGGYETSSGVSVNSDSAMRLITVQNCVRVRVAAIAQLPCHIMKRDGKMREKAEDFYLYEKLHDQPNSWMTASEFWGMVEAHICLRGNFYAYKLQSPVTGEILELIPLTSDRVMEVMQNPDYSLTYKVSMKDGTVKEIPGSKMFHVRGLTLDGITGANPIQYARETMGLGLGGVKFFGRFLGKGLNPGAVIKHPASLNAPAHADLKQRLKEKYTGLGQSWELMLLDEGMEITFPTIKPVDAQFLELMKMTEAQICGLYRVPLMLVQSGDKAPTYASAEQFFINFTTIGVTPDLVNYEKAIRRDLLTPEERTTYYAKFTIDGLLRGDFKARMEGFSIAIDKEIMNPNEVRDLLDMNPYEGGDQYRTRTSTTRDAGASQGAQT